MPSGLFSPARLQQRRDRLRLLLEKSRLDAVLVVDRLNALYLTGFDGSNCRLVVTRDHGDFFLTDFRYIEVAQKSLRGMQVLLMRQFGDSVFPGLLRERRIRKLGFEESQAWGAVQALAEGLKGVSLRPAGKLLSQLRMVKDSAEVQAIAQAQRLNESMQDAAFGWACRGGLSELQLQRRMRDFLADHNAVEAFETIVAGGRNSSLPHARPTSAVISAAHFLLLDSGAKQSHYHSDMTRTLVLGRGTQRHREIYGIVLDAQKAALQTIRAGIPCRRVDAAARKVIDQAGYREAFGHGTGHGVGLEIHEGPRLNQTSKDVLEPGMVVTVEPGIYLPGFGGVRIEDLVVVTDKGHRNLTSADKDYRELPMRSTKPPRRKGPG